MGTRRPSRPRRFLAAVAVLVTACAQGEAQRQAALEASSPVTFTAADGVALAGRLFGEGTVGVVLAHMRPADQSSWFPFAARLAQEGYLALTFNFRGYCPGGDAGCSEGEPALGLIWQDVEAAVSFLRSRGAQRVALVGASMGGTAALVVAARQGPGIAAVVTLSAPESIDGLVAGPDVLQQIPAAKLFVAGEFDTTAAEAARRFYEAAGQPKRLEIVPSEDHGTDLLSGNQGEVVRNLVLSYLAQFARG